MFGLLSDKLKIKNPAKGINKVIVDINTVIKPHLTVIDGSLHWKERDQLTVHP